MINKLKRERDILALMLDYDQVTIKGLISKLENNRQVRRIITGLVESGLVYRGDPIDIDAEMDEIGLLTGENRQIKYAYIVNYNMAEDRISEIDIDLYERGID